MADLPVAMAESLYTALHHRPDISRSIREVRASATRLGVARNEVLPKLDLLASTYVAGLAGGTNTAQSFGNQFADGRPSYSVGLLFEMPFGNRAAACPRGTAPMGNEPGDGSIPPGRRRGSHRRGTGGARSRDHLWRDGQQV